MADHIRRHKRCGRQKQLIHKQTFQGDKSIRKTKTHIFECIIIVTWILNFIFYINLNS